MNEEQPDSKIADDGMSNMNYSRFIFDEHPDDDNYKENDLFLYQDSIILHNQIPSYI